MSLPQKFEILVITLSDRAFRGEYKDLSGKLIREHISKYFILTDWTVNLSYSLIPDDKTQFEKLLLEAQDKYDIIFTTGGTGIGPRDITIETVKPLLNKEIPGIMEYIRVKYGNEMPDALLSRGVAGIMGKSLIYTLPGSVKAVDEYMTEILKTLKHAVLMQHGIDGHGKNQ